MANAREKARFQKAVRLMENVSEIICYMEEIKLYLDCSINKHFFDTIIVGKRVHTPPPFSKIPPFLEIQDVPTFYRPIRKTKVLNDS